MKTLLLSGQAPWPPDTGARLRLTSVLEALGGIGPVDLFFLTKGAQLADAQGAGLACRIGGERRPAGAVDPVRRARHLLLDRTPSRYAKNYRPARQALQTFTHGHHYDLVWFSEPEAWVVWRGALDKPAATIVDFFDLDDEKMRLELATVPAAHARGAPRRLVRTTDMRRTRRLQAQIVRLADAVTACSTEDARALGDQVHVVPNTYPRPTRPCGDRATSTNLLFVGGLDYGPNADAVGWFSRDIAPLLGAASPELRLRVVGSTTNSRPAVAGNVDLVGRVGDLQPELESALAAIVPLRYGSGTRLKILEAFAHRIPVVTTSVGCSGLAVEPGRHALVADSAEDFAAACLALERDHALRTRLVDQAHQLYLRSYTPDVARAAVSRAAAIARAAAQVGP